MIGDEFFVIVKTLIINFFRKKHFIQKIYQNEYKHGRLGSEDPADNRKLTRSASRWR